MEEILNLIKQNLTGDYEKDNEVLNSLENEQNQMIKKANATIQAINILRKEIENVLPEEESDERVEPVVDENDDRTAEEIEIDNMIDELFDELDNVEDKSMISIGKIEKIIDKVESLTDSTNEKEIHCSFSNDIERLIFEKIFAKDKEIVITPYKNDVLYIIYADILLSKRRKTAALEALDRAIYWNFLNREARAKKLDILYDRSQYVKYLETLKTLQSISYTPEDLADCYNKYAYIFNELKDKEAAYGMYKLSYYYYPREEVANVIKAFEEEEPEFKELSQEELIKHIKENEVTIGPNSKIIDAHRDITKDFLNEGRLEDAQIMLENDYNLTRDEQIAALYNQLTSVVESQALKEEEEIVEEKAPKPKKTRKKTKKEEEPKEEKAKEEAPKKRGRKKKEEAKENA